ncbi:hypothetical protein LEMLEM_LOCUS9360 [Lemmus lemmus]
MTGIVHLDNGSLNVTYFHRKDGKCVKEFFVAEETDIPGRYTFEYQGKNYLTFVAVTKDFVIMDFENHCDGNTLIVVELHGGCLPTHSLKTAGNDRRAGEAGGEGGK